MSKILNNEQGNNTLPAIILLCPAKGVLPDGFPVAADNIYTNGEVLKKLAGLDEIRNDKQSSGSAEPPVQMWMIEPEQLRFLRELCKYIELIHLKALMDVPEAEYLAPWTILVSDLSTYSVDQFTSHVDMDDPAKQVESPLTEENQIKKMNKTMNDLTDMLSKEKADDNLDDLGQEGVDDTPQD